MEDPRVHLIEVQNPQDPPPPLPDGALPGDEWEPACKWHTITFDYNADNWTDLKNQYVADGWSSAGAVNWFKKWLCPGDCHYIN